MMRKTFSWFVRSAVIVTALTAMVARTTVYAQSIPTISTNSTTTSTSSAPRSCTPNGPKTCVDATPCKTINGVVACLEGTTPPQNGMNVGSSCWQYKENFNCNSLSTVDDCKPLVDQGCGMLSSSCADSDADGKCLMWTDTYRCETSPAVPTTTTQCTSNMCAGGNCFDMSSPADNDFGAAAAMNEAQRQAGVYGKDGLDIFKGFHEECSVKVLGGSSIKSCCKPTAGGGQYKNSAVLNAGMQAGGAVITEWGKEAARLGSQYLYDALYASLDSALMAAGSGAAASAGAEAAAASGGSTFGLYGFTFSYSIEAGFTFVGFDPVTFGISIAIMVITAWLGCDADDKVVGLKLGQNLCVPIGTRCSSKVLGVCVTKREMFCCFNSILSKLIHQQGKAQLAMDTKNCGGFTADQLQKIDFSKIDFAEFIASIKPSTQSTANATNRAQHEVNNRVQNYYNR